MTQSALARKMKRPAQGGAVLINAPAGYEAASFAGLAPAVTRLSGRFAWIQIFVQNKRQLDELAPKAARCLSDDSTLWITFPKGTSKIQTDLSRDRGWAVIALLDLKRVTLIFVNETWSAFAFRPYKAGEARQTIG